jgi:hypothetical protein
MPVARQQIPKMHQWTVKLCFLRGPLRTIAQQQRNGVFCAVRAEVIVRTISEG